MSYTWKLYNVVNHCYLNFKKLKKRLWPCNISVKYESSVKGYFWMEILHKLIGENLIDGLHSQEGTVLPK